MCCSGTQIAPDESADSILAGERLEPGVTPMSLPKKEEKGYLEIQDSGKSFVIAARNGDAAALAALFLQYGISCEREQGAAEVIFHFPEGLPRSDVEGVLEGYKTAKGS
jgi:hypothetical protein